VTALLLVLALPVAEAGKKRAVEVTVAVVDEAGAPVPTAVVRHPAESDRHRVNAATGKWSASVLYLPDGSELAFRAGETIQLEISAPGFKTRVVSYDVRKRGNELSVALADLDLESTEVDEPIIQSGRDRLREDAGGAPAN
jgi:hypothetical protein